MERDPAHRSNDTVLAELQANTVREMMSANRLRYLRRMLMTGPKIVWALAKAEDEFDKSWLDTVREDCAWLQSTLPDKTPKASPGTEADAWSKFIAEAGNWKQLVGEALQVTAKTRSMMHRVDDERAHFMSAMKEAGIEPHENEEEEGEAEEAKAKGHICEICGKSFKRAKDL